MLQAAIPLSMWVLFHMGSWLIQWAGVNLVGSSYECDVPLCDTPLRGIGRITEKDPEFSIAFVGGVLGDVGNVILSVLFVQWEIYRGEGFVMNIVWIGTTGIAAVTISAAIAYFVINIRR